MLRGYAARDSRIQGVIFDFNGTLARGVPPWPRTHARVLARHGLAPIAEQWGDQWEIGPADGEEHVEHSASETAYRRWELERLAARARDCKVRDDLIEALVVDLDHATKNVVLAVFDDVLDVLEELRQRGLLVGVCSNWSWALDEAIEAVGLTGAFDVTVGSAQAGARKPHHRIYDAALQGSGLAADEVLFVGDTWTTDVEGPLAMGMHAVHLCREPLHAHPADIPYGASRVADLREIPALLTTMATAP